MSELVDTGGGDEQLSGDQLSGEQLSGEQSAWYSNTRTLALAIAVTIGVLLLAALASVIDLPDDDAQNLDSTDQTAANGGAANSGAGQAGGAGGAGEAGGAGGTGGAGEAGGAGGTGGAGEAGGAGGSPGRIDMGDGLGLNVQPIPGCPGGLALGDDILIVPDPEACGFEPLPPGATGFESSGKSILVPDADGNIGGFRLGPDGIELVAPEDVSANDFVVGLLPDGSFGLIRPDGSAVEIIPGDDGLILRDPERGSNDFVPAPGQGFGTESPPIGTGQIPQAAADPSDDESALPLRLLLLIVGLLAALAAGLWYWSRRAESGQTLEPKAAPEIFATEIDALDRLLWEIDQEPDPRAAIRKAYAALETGLGNPSMARRQPETPGLFLHRLLGRFDDLNGPLQELVLLFEHARFSEHEITIDMRDRAIRALGEIRGRYAMAVAEHEQPVSVS